MTSVDRPLVTPLDPDRYQRTPWKNGGGVTTDIAFDGDVWRFGRTPITVAGPFSDYTGFDRLQVLVAGSGLVLQTPAGEIDVRQPFRPVRFAGETPIVSRLESGPVEVVNLMGMDDGALDRFLAAEHAAWEPARQMGAQTHALLDSLRDRGLATGLVSNAFDPGWLLHGDLARMGLAERLDAAVFSSEIGKRKPHPSIFENVLERLDVAPEDALFVGDRRYEDVRGAKELGMTTVLALWFRADDDERGLDPDYEAFTPMDVLNVVRRLTNEI